MDPMSFTASLVTVVAAAITTGKILRRLWCLVKDSPEQFGELQSVIEETDLLLRLLEEIGNSLHSTSNGPGLLILWERRRARILEELRKLEQWINAILANSQGVLSTPVHFRSRTKLLFSASALDRLCRRLKECQTEINSVCIYIILYALHYPTHRCINLTLASLTFNSNSNTTEATAPLLINHENRVLDAITSGFHKISADKAISECSDFNMYRPDQVEKLIDDRHQQVLHNGDFHSNNEVSLRADGISDSRRSPSSVQQNLYRYSFLMGTLWMEQHVVRQLDAADTLVGSCEKANRDHDDSETIKIVFKPRLWLSPLVIRASIARQSNYWGRLSCSIEPVTHLGVLEINEMPPDRRLLAIGNIEGYSHAFEVNICYHILGTATLTRIS